MCVHGRVTSFSSVAFQENFLCLFSRSLPFLQDIKLQVYSCYQGASLFEQSLLLGSVTDQHVSDARLNVLKHKDMQSYARIPAMGLFTMRKQMVRVKKASLLWQRNSSSPHPHPPTPPQLPFPRSPLLPTPLHSIALTETFDMRQHHPMFVSF